MRFSSFTYLVGQGLHNLKANKMMTFASMGVLIVCMILVGAAFLFGANIDSMVAYIGEQNETVAFINDDADTAAVEEATLSCPLARKPLASRTMNTPIQVAWIQSLRSGRIQRPVSIRNNARRMPPMTMRLPPTRKGPATPRLNL